VKNSQTLVVSVSNHELGLVPRRAQDERKGNR
jgi:hypothetical protein